MTLQVYGEKILLRWSIDDWGRRQGRAGLAGGVDCWGSRGREGQNRFSRADSVAW